MRNLMVVALLKMFSSTFFTRFVLLMELDCCYVKIYLRMKLSGVTRTAVSPTHASNNLTGNGRRNFPISGFQKFD